MEVIPIADELPDAPPQEGKAAPIEASPLGRQSLLVETLEDRVLLTAEAPASVAAGVELPPSPAAYVAQQHPPRVQPSLGDVLAAASDAPGGSDDGATAGADAPGGNGNSQSGGLAGHLSEPHAEIVERTSEIREKGTVEPELQENAERRFDEEGSAEATIEPEGARSPRDREAAQRLLGSARFDVAPSEDADPSDTEPTELESTERAAATASAMVSLTNQREQVMDNLGLNPVVDQLADQLALDAATAHPGPSAGWTAQAEHGAAAAGQAGDEARGAADEQHTPARPDTAGPFAGAADADPLGDAVAAYVIHPAGAVDRAADAVKFIPAGDIDNDIPAAHDAVFAHGQAMAERLPS